MGAGDLPSKLGNQTNFTLFDRLERVGAAEAARNRTHTTDKRAQTVDHTRIPAMGSGILSILFDLMGVSGLQVIGTRRLHVDQTTGPSIALVLRDMLAGIGRSRHFGRYVCSMKSKRYFFMEQLWNIKAEDSESLSRGS